MTQHDTTSTDTPGYEELHGVVVEAMEAESGGRDAAAHEVLDRLRDAGLPVPGRTDDYADNADNAP